MVGILERKTENGVIFLSNFYECLGQLASNLKLVGDHYALNSDVNLWLTVSLDTNSTRTMH